MNRVQTFKKKIKDDKERFEKYEATIDSFVKLFKVKKTKKNEKEFQKVCPTFSFKKKKNINQLELI